MEKMSFGEATMQRKFGSRFERSQKGQFDFSKRALQVEQVIKFFFILFKRSAKAVRSSVFQEII